MNIKMPQETNVSWLAVAVGPDSTPTPDEYRGTLADAGQPEEGGATKVAANDRSSPKGTTTARLAPVPFLSIRPSLP